MALLAEGMVGQVEPIVSKPHVTGYSNVISPPIYKLVEEGITFSAAQ